MFTLHRIVMPLVNAFFITICLLYLMFSLIHLDEPELQLKRDAVKMDWAPVYKEEEVRIINPKPLPPQEVLAAPAVPKDVDIVDFKIDQKVAWVDNYEQRPKQKIFQIDNSQLLLAFGVPPIYPSSALRRGIEGYAVVGFSVSRSGAVYNPFIIESEPKGTFDRASVKAILKFKYKSRMVEGKSVNTEGQRYMFTYKID